MALRITVVTPSYNQAAYLPRTLDSVLSQAGDFHLEYIVNDGGSSDASPQVLQDYADRVKTGTYPVSCLSRSFQFQVKKDRGQSDAINQGFARSTGDVLCWLNSDDEFPPGALAAVAKVFAETPGVDFINGDGEVIDEEGRLQWAWLSRPYDYRVLTGYHGWWNNFSNYLLQQATFWRRSAYERLGPLDESFHFGMDIEYWLRAGNAGCRWLHVRQNLGRFRLIAGTKSLSSLTAFWPDYLEIFRRYRGVGSLHRYFAFYHYNLAHEQGLDIAATEVAAERMIARRWPGLPAGELAELRGQSDLGRSRAYALLASELYRNGDAVRAGEFFARAKSGSPTRHHLAYLTRRAIGQPLTRAVDHRLQQLAKAYRSYRYDYRYRSH